MSWVYINTILLVLILVLIGAAAVKVLLLAKTVENKIEYIDRKISKAQNEVFGLLIERLGSMLGGKENVSSCGDVPPDKLFLTDPVDCNQRRVNSTNSEEQSKDCKAGVRSPEANRDGSRKSS